MYIIARNCKLLIAPKPKNEVERVQALKSLQVLDTPINPIFERITRITKQIFGVPVVAISIIDSERQWFKSTQGMNVCENDLSTSFCSHTILQNDVFVVPDSLKDERFFDNPCVYNDPHARFYAGCPVKSADGYNIGTLCIIDSRPRDLTQEEKDSLRDIAILVQDELQKYHHSYTHLQVIKELDQAKRAKLIDPLTGAWNRAGMELNLSESIKEAKEHKHNLVIGLYDIDNFKKVNDTYGHNAGDMVIREVCKTMVMSLDEEDIVGRWGGEEFVIILKTTSDYSDVLRKIDNGRAQVNMQPIIFDDKKIPVSITIGLKIFDYNDAEKTLTELISQADSALYIGKNSGKNRMEIYADSYPKDRM